MRKVSEFSDDSFNEDDLNESPVIQPYWSNIEEANRYGASRKLLKFAKNC